MRITPSVLDTGGTVTYAVAMFNGDAGDAEAVSITDTIPIGFSYQTGSTKGATTDDPNISGQELTWGPFSLSADSVLTLTFRATAANAPGVYRNSVSGSSTNGIVIPPDDAALVEVGGALYLPIILKSH